MSRLGIRSPSPRNQIGSDNARFKTELFPFLFHFLLFYGVLPGCQLELFSLSISQEAGLSNFNTEKQVVAGNDFFF